MNVSGQAGHLIVLQDPPFSFIIMPLDGASVPLLVLFKRIFAGLLLLLLTIFLPGSFSFVFRFLPTLLRFEQSKAPGVPPDAAVAAASLLP